MLALNIQIAAARRGAARILLGLALATTAGAAPTPEELVAAALPLVCADAPAQALTDGLAGISPDAGGAMREALNRDGQVLGWRQRLVLADGRALHLERVAPGAQLRRAGATVYDAAARPQLLALTDGQCNVRAARAIRYDGSGHAAALRFLDPQLRDTGRGEPLNPPLPPAPDVAGVTVAVLDSGVNYLLAPIAARLARDTSGAGLGRDFWDLDQRPFDANPSRSPFFPQRHGTRTASVLLREAPAVRLLPYRYPRPDMSRMDALVGHAAAAGARVMNLSLGGNEAAEWQAFARAAREHPQILFIASAGNNGRDIDREPVYPAALELDNLLTVTSSAADGYPAESANWGRRHVDLLVPGEEIPALDFDGSPRRVSGSSYAAARLSALATRILERNPHYTTAQLREAILTRALPPPEPLVAHGWIPDPLHAADDGASATLAVRGNEALAGTAPAGTRRFAPALLVLSDSGWSRERALEITHAAGDILAACGIALRPARLLEIQVPPVLRDFHPGHARALLRLTPATTPLVAFVRDTVDEPAFDAVTFGTGNSRHRPWLRFSIWITAQARDAAVALAHELAHLLLDSGTHTDAPGNLMHPDTTPGATTLQPAQCREMLALGERNGLLGAP